jgi:hypothetical protein
MATYDAGIRTGAGSTTLPIISLYSAAAVNGRIQEIGVSNTTAVAVALKIVRLTTAGTSTAITSFLKNDPTAVAASCTPRGTHSSTGPTITESGHFAILPGVIGAAYIWTFRPPGLIVDVGTANGVGVIPATGTGQVLDAYIVWEE